MGKFICCVAQQFAAVAGGATPGRCQRATMNDLNAAFLKLRDQCGWTRTRIARQLRVHPSTVLRWETGDTTPDRSKLMLLASLTGLAVELDGERFQAAHDAPRTLEPWEAEMLDALRRLPPPQRRGVALSVAALANATARPVSYAPARRRKK